MISDLGGWVLRTAVEQLKQWRTDPLTAGHNFSMRINVSAADLQRLEFIEDVREALVSADLDPSLLVLELTESAVIQGNDLDRYTLNSLRRLAWDWRLTISAPATPPSATFANCPWIRSKWIGRCSPPWAATLRSQPFSPPYCSSSGPAAWLLCGRRGNRRAGRVPPEHRVHQRPRLLLQPSFACSAIDRTAETSQDVARQLIFRVHGWCRVRHSESRIA